MKDSNSNPFQPNVVFHIETSQLFCRAKQLTGFYMKRNTALFYRLNLVNIALLNYQLVPFEFSCCPGLVTIVEIHL